MQQEGPPRGRTGRASSVVAGLVAAWLTLGVACKRGVEPVPEAKAVPSASASVEHDEHLTLPRRVKLTPLVEKDAKIRTGKVRRAELAPTIKLPGEIAADPDKSGQISSPVAGRVEEVRVQQGSVVKRGDPVVVLRVPDLGRVRGALAATRARAKGARANEERLRALYEKGLTPEREYLDVRADAEAYEAEARALGEQLTAVGAGAGGSGVLLQLRTPVSGVVVSRTAVRGQPVGTEQVLAEITDLSEVWFLARVFEKDLGALAPGAVADIELNAYPKRRFAGTVERIGQKVDPVARTITARVRVSNPEGVLRLGLFGVAHVVVSGEAKPAGASLVVPRSAVVEIAGKTVVFVRQADGEYELHDVVLGDAAPGEVAVVTGLREGEEIVTEGAFTLKSVVLRATLDDHD